MIDEIIKTVKATFEDTFKYTDKKKLKDSGYFVSCVENEIGKVAFDNDYQITTEEVKEITEKIFA